MIQKVSKRDGTIVEFDLQRIENAIYSAAQSVGGSDKAIARQLSHQVEQHLLENYIDQLPDVEKIQDIVEKILIETGHAQTAKAYILYRAKQADIREEKKKELLEKIGKNQAEIQHKDGSKSIFDIDTLLKSIDPLINDLKKVHLKNVVEEALKNLYNGIKTDELKKALINAARTNIERHPQYSLLASRLLFDGLYQQLLQCSSIDKQFESSYKNSFAQYIEKGIKEGLLNEELREFDLELISNAIRPAMDKLFHYRGAQTIFDRYLLRESSENRQIFELPQYLWMRVALGLALSEKKELRNEKAVEFYNVMAEMLYTPSTPTLFNAGTNHSQLSSCFLNTTSDSLSGIFKMYSDNAMLSKFAGGLGTDWTNVRSMGSLIKGTNGNSQGIIPFLKIFNDIAVAVNQGGKRKGAMCAYLEIWHGDVEEFIEAKKNTGDDRRRLHDVHTALWIPDLFMKRVIEDGDWTLFSPAEAVGLHDSYGKDFEQKYIAYEQKKLPSSKTISALSFWRKVLTHLFETGHPWLTFKDACNVRNPQDHVGVIHNSNLCTEITLNNSGNETAVCNLGSINLSKMFLNNKKVNNKLLKSTVKTAIRMLDNVIDINYYPTVETKNSNSQHRPIGLGIMGYQDALYKMDYNFASEEHLDFADRLMEEISYYALEASSDLAQEKGIYSSFKGSKWERGILPIDTLSLLEKERGMPIQCDKTAQLDWDALREKIKKQGMRNSNTLAIAPTATISNITGVHPCIEPAFRNIYVKENTDGSFVVINNAMVEDLERLKLWNQRMIDDIKLHNGSIAHIEQIPQKLKDKYKEVFEIEPAWILKAAARRGKWIDQSQSVNIFLDTTSGKILNDTYLLAWQLGLKTTYYLRSLSASQVRSNVALNQESVDQKEPEPTTSNIDDVICEVCQ